MWYCNFDRSINLLYENLIFKTIHKKYAHLKKKLSLQIYSLILTVLLFLRKILEHFLKNIFIFLNKHKNSSYFEITKYHEILH